MITLALWLLSTEPLPSTPTRKTPTPTPTPRGTYAIADAAAANAAVDAAIADAVKDVVFFARPFAAGTLREANVVDAVLVVVIDDAARIRVHFAGQDVVTVEGVPADVVVDAHGTARVVQRRDGADIVQTATRKEGTRTVRIHAVDADHVDVDVRFDSAALGRPLHHQLRYRRVAP